MHSINEVKNTLPSNKFQEFRFETEEKARKDLENFNIQHTAMLQTNRQNMLTIAREAKTYILDYDKTCKNTWLESKKKMYEREAADLRLELGIKKRHQIQVELTREKNEKDMKESIDAFELNFRRMGFQPQDWKDPTEINNKFTWRTETAFDQFTRLKTLYSTISYAKPSQTYLKTMHSKRRQDVLAFRDKTVRERVNNVIQKNAQLTAEEQDRIRDLLVKCNNKYKSERKNALEYQKQLYLKENERNKSIENAKLIQEKIEKENNEYYQQLIEISTKKRIENEIELTQIIEAQNAKKELRNKLKHEDTLRFCEVMVFGLADLAMTCARWVENNKCLMPPVVWSNFRKQYVRGIPFFEDSITGDLTLAKDWELILDSRTDYLIYRNNINDCNDSLIPPFILTDGCNDIFQIISIICDILNQKWPEKPLPPVPTHPIGILLIGPPLCGKSEICKHLEFQFYMRIIDPLLIVQEAVKDTEDEIAEANKPKSPKNKDNSRKSSVKRKSKSGKSPRDTETPPLALNPLENPTSIINTPIPEDEEAINLPPHPVEVVKPRKLTDIYISDSFKNEYRNLIEELKKALKKPKKGGAASSAKPKKGQTEVIDTGRIEEFEGYIQLPKIANVIGAMANEIMSLPHGSSGGYVIEGNGLTVEQLMMISHLVSPNYVEKLGKGCETPELFIKKSKGKKFEYPKRNVDNDPRSVWGENTLCNFGIIVLEEEEGKEDEYKNTLEERSKNLNLDKLTGKLGINPPPPTSPPPKTEEEEKKEAEEEEERKRKEEEEEKKEEGEEEKKNSKKVSKRTSKLPPKSKVIKSKEPEPEENIPPPPLPYIPYPFTRKYEQYKKELINYKNWISIAENGKDIKIINNLDIDKFNDKIDEELETFYKENTIIYHEQNPEAAPEPPPKDPTEGHDLNTIDGITNYIIDMVRTERWETVKEDPDKIPCLPNIMNVINENDSQIENEYCDILSSVRKLLNYIDERFNATEMKFLEFLENKTEDLENVDKKFKLLVKQFYNNEISSDDLRDSYLEFNHKEWVNAFNRLEEAKRQIPKLAESDWLQDVLDKIANKFGDLLTQECEHWMKMLNVLMNYFENIRGQKLSHELMMNSMPLIGSEMSQVSQTQSPYDGLDFCFQNTLNTIEESINALMNSIRPATPPPVEEVKEEEKKEEPPAAVEETSTPLPTENEEKKAEEKEEQKRSESPSKNKKGKKGKSNSPRGTSKGTKKGKSPKGNRKSKKGKSPTPEDELKDNEEEVKTETPPPPPPPPTTPPPPKPEIMEDDYNKAICEGYIQIIHRLHHLYETFKNRLSEFENKPSDFASKCYQYTKDRNFNESSRLTNFTNSIEDIISNYENDNNTKKELLLPRYSLDDKGYYKLYTYQEKKLLIPSLENINKYVDICLKYCDKKLLIQIPKLYSIISESIDKGILSKEWLVRFTPNEIQNIAISYDTHGIGSFYLGDYIHDIICCKYGIPLLKDILKAFSSCKATDSEMKGELSINQFKSTDLCFKLESQDERDLLHLIYIKIFRETKETTSKESKEESKEDNSSSTGYKVDYISYLLQLCHIEQNDHKEKNVFRHKGFYSAFLVLTMCGGYNEVINQMLMNKLVEKEVKKGLRGKVEDIWSELNANSEMLLSWMDLCDSNQFSWWAKKGMYIAYNSCLQH